MGLSAEEKRQLELLKKKESEPDPSPIGRRASFSIDLGDDRQVKRAIRLGLIDDPDADDGGGGDDGDDDADDETPRRRGYFPDN